MPNDVIKHVEVNGTTYDIVDAVSGYIKSSDIPVTDVKVDNTSIVTSKVADLKTSATNPYNASTNVLATMADVAAAGVAKDGALKLQKDSGTAATIFTANQEGDSTLTYTTTSVGSASGWSAGTVPTLGTAISADDITSWTANTPTAIDTTKFVGGSFTRGTFSGGSFTQGTDSFTQNTPTKIDTTKFNGGSYTAATYSWSSNTPTTIDTTKFNGGSFTRGTFSGGSFTQGSDSFSAATLVPSLASSSATASNPTTLTISFTGGSFTQGTDSFTAASHGNDTFTAASLATGFYTAGSAASWSVLSNPTFTPASLATGFYTAGTSASFTQGTDSFTAATHANDTFVPASLSSGFYTAGSAASLSYTSRSIPNLTSIGTAPSLTITSTEVINGLSAS